jgi:hypothetical protein
MAMYTCEHAGDYEGVQARQSFAFVNGVKYWVRNQVWYWQECELWLDGVVLMGGCTQGLGLVWSAW